MHKVSWVPTWKKKFDFLAASESFFIFYKCYLTIICRKITCIKIGQFLIFITVKKNYMYNVMSNRRIDINS